MADQELSFQLAQKGYRLVFAPRAIVYHAHHPTLGRYVRRKCWIGYWKAYLLRRHPANALGDSYTPLTERAQVGLAGLGVAACLAARRCPPEGGSATRAYMPRGRRRVAVQIAYMPYTNAPAGRDTPQPD